MIGRIPILAVVVLGLTLTGVPAKAIPILSGTTWISTGDPIVGDNWITGSFTTGDGIAATAPYPNPVTTPDDILPGTLAELMWFCGACQDAGGTVTGSDGPTKPLGSSCCGLRTAHWRCVTGNLAMKNGIRCTACTGASQPCACSSMLRSP